MAKYHTSILAVTMEISIIGISCITLVAVASLNQFQPVWSSSVCMANIQYHG